MNRRIMLGHIISGTLTGQLLPKSKEQLRIQQNSQQTFLNLHLLFSELHWTGFIIVEMQMNVFMNCIFKTFVIESNRKSFFIFFGKHFQWFECNALFANESLTFGVVFVFHITTCCILDIMSLPSPKSFQRVLLSIFYR